NAALRCEQRLAILERSETAKRCESLLNALLCVYFRFFIFSFGPSGNLDFFPFLTLAASGKSPTILSVDVLNH
ncbi:hypothetical protein ACSTEP_22795, partial [Vibrio vulnificus]|uniref:hypothetical protein n=1 Tax=Vibrio vulnificus TaxID=672 RepID=UPI003ED9B0A3